MIINRKRASVQAINIEKERHVTFIPGNNVIAEADEDLLSKNETHIALVKNGVHEIVQACSRMKKTPQSDIEPSTDVINEILKLSAKKARAIIENIFDKKVLEDILDKDKRSGIHDVVFSQLKKLELPEDIERTKDGTIN